MFNAPSPRGGHIRKGIGDVEADSTYWIAGGKASYSLVDSMLLGLERERERAEKGRGRSDEVRRSDERRASGGVGGGGGAASSAVVRGGLRVLEIGSAAWTGSMLASVPCRPPAHGPPGGTSAAQRRRTRHGVLAADDDEGDIWPAASDRQHHRDL